jgi:hypothetical protein
MYYEKERRKQSRIGGKDTPPVTERKHKARPNTESRNRTRAADVINQREENIREENIL